MTVSISSAPSDSKTIADGITAVIPQSKQHKTDKKKKNHNTIHVEYINFAFGNQ